MSITIVTYLWGQRYGAEYVARLAEGVRRHMPRPYRFVVIADGALCRDLHQTTWEIPREDYPLLAIPGCFARLRLFDPAFQAEHHLRPDDRIVCMDLDMIITGPLAPLFERLDPFVILRGVNASNPCPFNGSLWMLRAGYRPDVWTDFTMEAARAVPFDSFPDDQAWFAAKMPDAGGWGPRDGVFAFGKPGWPGGDELPANARVVAFPGKRDPAQFTKLPWVRKHWLTR